MPDSLAGAMYPNGPSSALGNQTDEPKQQDAKSVTDHIDDAISQVSDMNDRQKATMRSAMVAKFRDPSFVQSFVAGAKDFGIDFKKMLSGEISGPSFENRKKLWEAQ